MQIEKSVGGIVINGRKVLVVYQAKTDSWALPKGHITSKETLLETAKREIFEETGITDLKLVKKLGSYERKTRVSANIKKQITYFLFTTDQTKLSPMDKENPVAKWVSIDRVSKILSYTEDKNFFLKIRDKIPY